MWFFLFKGYERTISPVEVVTAEAPEAWPTEYNLPLYLENTTTTDPIMQFPSMGGAVLDSSRKYAQIFEEAAIDNLFDGHIFGTSRFVQIAIWLEELQKNNAVGKGQFCETGFNAGSSAVIMLEQNFVNHLRSFDLGTFDYSEKCRDLVTAEYPGRFEAIFGDSRSTVPEFSEKHPDWKCDLWMIDGGHNGDVPKKDIESALRASRVGTTFYFDDYGPCSYCLSVKNAVDSFVASGNISPIQCSPSVWISENPPRLEEGHFFCRAQVIRPIQ